MKLFKINLRHFLFILLFEFVFGLMVFDSFAKETIISTIIYSLFASFIITILTTIFSEKVNKIINYSIYFILGIWFSLQFVFKSFLKTFFSLSLFKLTDQAMDFTGEVFKIILNNLYAIIIFLIPFVLFIVFRKKIKFEIGTKKIFLLIYVVLISLSYFGYTLYLNNKKNSDMSIYDLYYKIDNIPLSVQKLGVLSSAGIDIYRTIFGFDEVIIPAKNDKEESTSIITYDDNKLDLEFDDNLSDQIKDYINGNPGTSKNEYTGIFKNKNLIFIVAESFSEIAARKDVTPTLYKLINSGFVFNNFYVPYYLSTIGGEFQSLTGLYPDSSTLSTWRRGNNTFTYGLANTFKNNSYNTFAYHDHSGYFQDRYKYLKSLGFDNFKACYMGLQIDCDIWPESDIEMIEKTYGDYINSDKPFMTYYMTVSGHLEYTFSDNSMSSKNRNLVENLPYSEPVKAYLAATIELDRALEILLNKLEENGKLNDTVIVMLADHYPYGLTLDEVNELSSYKRDDTFEINHNSLIIWNNKIKTINIDKVGAPVDVIPTIYNLFGIDYDSRLFAGNDLLSNSGGLAILGNRSWITNYGRYNSVDNIYTGEKDSDYVSNINNIVQNKIVFSKNIIDTDGYKYIREK